MKFVRLALGLAAVLGGVLAVSYLQGRFDGSDLDKALLAVGSRFPLLSECRGEIVSRLRGSVSVRCRDREFLVDVVKGTIEDRGGQAP